MCADDYVFVSLSRKPGENIVDRCAGCLDIDVEGEMQSIAERKRIRLRRGIDLFLCCLQWSSRRLEPCGRGSVFDLDHRDSDVLRAADAAETR